MGTPRRRALAVAGSAAVVMAVAQITIPLTARRTGLSTIVVVALAGCALGAAAAAWGGLRTALAAALVGPTALAVEVVGTRTGWPFGSYHYHGTLQPTVFGVPAIVPLAWLGMGLAAWEVAGRLARSGVARIVTGAAALTAWDLFLDPQMTREGYWVWSGGGAYRDVPVSNYAGWFACAVVVMTLLALVLPGERRSLPLLGLYTWMAVMETLGFCVFFGDALVGLVGGAAMLPLVVVAWRRCWGRPGTRAVGVRARPAPGPAPGPTPTAA